MKTDQKKTWQTPKLTVVDFSKTLGGGAHGSENRMSLIGRYKKNSYAS